MKLPNGINPVHCASTDASRYILNGVHIKDGLAAGTNGRSLFVSTCEMESEDAREEAIIPSRIAIKAFKKKRKNGILPVLYLKAPEEGVYNECKMLDENMDWTTAREIDGKFPNWIQTVPMFDGYKEAVSIDVKYLIEMVKAFGGESQIKIYTTSEPRDPMLVMGKSQEAFAVVMPVRIASEITDNNAYKKVQAIKRSALEKESTNQ